MDPGFEFAFYSLDRGLIRLEQPSVAAPAACEPGTFNVGTVAGMGIGSTRDQSLNNLGQALVRVELQCQVGRSSLYFQVPAFATVKDGIQFIPLPRGLQVEDLFEEVVNQYGETVNVFAAADISYFALNDRGKMAGNFFTISWDDTFETTAHIYDLTPMPIADIEANGFDPPLTVSAGESVNITLALDPGEKLGQPGEYWGILLSSFGNFVLFDSQAELVEFGETSLFDAPLPVGWYVFVFNVDGTPDGLYQPGWLDYVVVEVKP